MTSSPTLQSWQAKAAALKTDGRPFIEGQRVQALSAETFDVLNPHSGATVGTLAACGQADVDRAVASARAAFDAGVWSALAPHQRSQILKRLA